MERVNARSGSITELGRQTLDFIASKKPAEERLWARLLATVASLPYGISRSPGEFFHAEDGSSSGRCVCTRWNADGTTTVYTFTATLQDGYVTTDAQESVDHHDATWEPGGRMDQDTEAHRRVIVDHVVYYLRPESHAPSHCKGFGGRRWDIVYHDGRRITTHDLWESHTVPPKWHHRFPDNARFDHSWQEQERA